ncbi:hypothetical protein VTL71DRAFT_14458 [Oculimacula yallundae]
MALRNLE